MIKFCYLIKLVKVEKINICQLLKSNINDKIIRKLDTYIQKKNNFEFFTSVLILTKLSRDRLLEEKINFISRHDKFLKN